jgi:hypothetical protein
MADGRGLDLFHLLDECRSDLLRHGVDDEHVRLPYRT